MSHASKQIIDVGEKPVVKHEPVQYVHKAYTCSFTFVPVDPETGLFGDDLKREVQAAHERMKRRVDEFNAAMITAAFTGRF